MTGEATLIRDPMHSDEDMSFELMELLFFGYRDFIGDADEILQDYDFGRAHHRVLHFVNRRPGIRVTDLLDILKITKQSLARVLKQLIDANYLLQQHGATDRRERLIFPTTSGRKLSEELSRAQSRRINGALKKLPPETREIAGNFLYALINDDERWLVKQPSHEIQSPVEQT